MIPFRTELQIIKTLQSVGNTIRYDSKVLLMGSCFTEHISRKLQSLAYDVVINPTGIIYQSIGMMRVLKLCLSNTFEYQSKDLFEHLAKFHSFDHHGSYSHSDASEVLKRIKADLWQGRKQVQQCDFLILTFGTSWGYALRSSSDQVFDQSFEQGFIVNNCHQLPAYHFERRWLSLDEQWIACCETLDLFFQINPKAHLILTVSPIRHMKDQLIENQRSKANLTILVHQLLEKYGQKASYFPAYEIMMDDLRDYRFYERDLIHPTEMAIDYIWEKFEAYALDDKDKDLRKTITQLRKSLNHRVLDEDTPQHRLFIEQVETKIAMTLEKYPILKGRLK
jgi:hypothetical protein